ncbi:MAG: hypothetical protein JNM56_30025 [Planctomycetia bacterium]|nr:hypothetical protein [Planctomycetia bacterium]
MLAYIVDKFVSSERINVFHYHMFHGKTVPIKSGDISHSHHAGDDLSQPVRIVRNGWRIPDISSPSVSLVVSGRGKEALGGVPHVSFLPIIFEKLVDYPYHAGDFSYYDTPQFKANPAKANPATLLERLSDSRELHRKTEPFYEMIVPKLNDVSSGYPDLQEYTVELPHCMDPVELKASMAVIRDHPIVWWSATVFHESVFKRIEPYFDWDYFSKATLEL